MRTKDNMLKIRKEKIMIGTMSFLIIALIFFSLSNLNNQENKLTGYAVSNIFFTSNPDSSTIGFVARESSNELAADYQMESAILLPSGEFNKDDFTVIIPYLEIDTTIAATQCSDGIDNDGDGLIDFGSDPTNDPDCTSLSDDDESEQPQLSPPGPSGGSGPRYEPEIRQGEVCDAAWQCSDYGECQESGLQYRVCVIVSCEYTDEINIPPKPSEVKSCKYKKPEEPESAQPPKEEFEFYVKPKMEKDYKPGDPIVLHTYINNPGDNNLNNLEIEYNIDEGAERTEYVEYEGVFDVTANTKYSKDMDHTLEGYSNKRYRIHATLYSNGEKLAESYYDLDLS